MAAPPLSDAQRAAILAVRLLHKTNLEAAAAIAPFLGMTPEGVRHQLKNYDEDAAIELLQELCRPDRPAELTHDVAFWRRKAEERERELGRAQRLVEELGGIRRVPVSAPQWLWPGPGPRRRAILLVHSSDWHDGEVIRPGEIQGVNEFNPEICERRLKRLALAACEIGARWMADCEPAGAIVTFAGDLISGDIHEELMRTNALTAHEQVRHAAGIGAAIIRTLLGAFPWVHGVGVPGNHGRTTPKPTAKLYGALSYDTLVVSMIADQFRNDPRVTWQADGATDQIVPVFGRDLLVTHGDKLGTRGGMGFAGPVLPIVRGGHKVRAQQASLGRSCDLMVIGHYHTSAAPPGILANGSVPGYSEYGRDLRGGLEPPKQWLALLTEKWGLRERLDVILEEPKPAAKPRVKAPAPAC